MINNKSNHHKFLSTIITPIIHHQIKFQHLQLLRIPQIIHNNYPNNILHYKEQTLNKIKEKLMINPALAALTQQMVKNLVIMKVIIMDNKGNNKSYKINRFNNLNLPNKLNNSQPPHINNRIHLKLHCLNNNKINLLRILLTLLLHCNKLIPPLTLTQ